MFEKYLPFLLPDPSSTAYQDTYQPQNTHTGVPEVQTPLVEVTLEDVRGGKKIVFALDVRLNTTPLVTGQEPLAFQFMSNDRTCKPIVYDTTYQGGQQNLIRNLCRAVTFEWMGTGENLNQIEGIPQLLYTKNFTIPQGIVKVKESFTNSSLVSYHYNQGGNGQLQACPVIACGTFIHPRMELDKCVPMYATLQAGDQGQTQVDFKSLLWWREKGFTPNVPGLLNSKTFMLEALRSQNEVQSLGQSISAGAVKIVLEDDLTYESFKYEIINPTMHLCRIYFREQI